MKTVLNYCKSFHSVFKRDVKKTRNLQRQAAQSLVNQKILNSTWRESPPSQCRQMKQLAQKCRPKMEKTNQNTAAITIKARVRFAKKMPQELLVKLSKYDYIADERSGYTKEYQINITLDLKRLVLLTSDIIITFTEAKPAEMVVEKSSNDGVSWSPIEFFSRNCSKINGLYENEWSSKFGSSIWKRPNCSEDVASWDAISTGRDLTVHIADKIRAMRGWSVAQENATNTVSYQTA
ncbi:Oidioi.mRNA.OKI2018_I69.PAR.g12190.t1.cds [Oikopleura dioica]|uniref:Oidioi.mRNA.OKI2018_I69.PAR.g12190.t1.cds n=1 Tax=Oikopleura dioica TaxID=34765 RepID=A0ABN7RZ29_OIKDI|nr:Oidioi.mRNA.OKI2018_I69.PAR.g12190.t1.cds [Oikopleura dioica]